MHFIIEVVVTDRFHFIHIARYEIHVVDLNLDDIHRYMLATVWKWSLRHEFI